MAEKIPGVDGLPWRPAADGLRLTVRLTPRALVDQVFGLGDGPDGPHVVAKVRAMPSDGAANAALARLVAAWLGLPRRAVGLVGGGKSRLKTLHLIGEPAELAERLRSRLRR